MVMMTAAVAALSAVRAQAWMTNPMHVAASAT